jgi:hypothetical protein
MAATVITTGGVTNLLVGDQLFNVTFNDGSCAVQFDGCDSVDDFEFSAGPLLNAAVDQLIAVLNVANLLVPGFLPNGCTGQTQCLIATPYEVVPSGIVNSQAVLGNLGLPWSGFAFGWMATDDAAGNISWAHWTNITAVPVPASGLLLLAGLAGLGALRRRKSDAA